MAGRRPRCRFGRRREARDLLIDWAVALLLTATVVAVLALTSCTAQPGAATSTAPTTLPGVRADGSETGWWTAVGITADGAPQPADLSSPAGTESPPPDRLVLPADLLFFTTDSAAIGADGAALLDDVARWLLDNGATVAVVGHTDATGSDTYNLELGRARAEAVTRALSDRGAPVERLTPITSEGERCPLATNETDAGRARNRRVELVVISTPAPTGGASVLCPVPSAAGPDPTGRR